MLCSREGASSLSEGQRGGFRPRGVVSCSAPLGLRRERKKKPRCFTVAVTQGETNGVIAGSEDPTSQSLAPLPGTWMLIPCLETAEGEYFRGGCRQVEKGPAQGRLHSAAPGGGESPAGRCHRWGPWRVTGSLEAQEVEKRKERPGCGRTAPWIPALPPPAASLVRHRDGETRDWGLGGLRPSRHCTTEIHLLVKRKENKETRFLQRCYKKPLKKPS